MQNFLFKRLRSVYLIILVLISLHSLINTQSRKCFNITQLTTVQTSHEVQIVSIKMNSNYTKLFTLDFNGTIKIWDLNENLSKLTLRQSINVDIYFNSYTSRFVLWNDGQKIFVGGLFRNSQNFIKILKFNHNTQKYQENQIEKIKVQINIDAMVVNKKGDQLYIGTNGDGVYKYQFNGIQWNQNTPQCLRDNTNIFANFMQLSQDQTKLFVLQQRYQNRHKQIKIYRLVNQTKCQAYQILDRGQSSLFDCKIANRQKFINCYGINAKYQNYMLDPATQKYINVSKPLSQSYSSRSIMDQNQIITILDANNITGPIQNYKFSYENNKPTYELINRYRLSQFDIPNLIATQKESKFQLFAAWNINDVLAHVFMVRCEFNNQDQMLSSNLKVENGLQKLLQQ